MKIQIKIKKTNGSLELLRFRLRDGRNVELSYSTKERIDVAELQRCYVCNVGESYITSDMIPANGVRRINPELKSKLDDYQKHIAKVYEEIKGNSALLNAKAFKERVDKEINGEADNKSDVLEVCYQNYINHQFDNGLLSKGRYAHYLVSLRDLRRFLVINKMLSVTINEFGGDQLLLLRTFLEKEYKYIDKYRSLYVGMDDRQIPTTARSQNTIASKMKFYRTFFNYLYESGEIERSPFQSIGASNRKVIMKERYDAPVFLSASELQQIRNADIPDNMQEVRDCFLLHCELGARVEDFKALSLDNVKTDEQGFAYVVYQPNKTADENGMVVDTPLMYSGLMTIKKYGFRFKILNNLWGKNGYNHKIKELVRLAGIDREVITTIGGIETRKIYDLASTKIARKSFVTALQQVQIDDFAAGLHSEKSDAVHRYGDASKIRKNRFVLMCAAFGEKPYKTDSHLNIL